MHLQCNFCLNKCNVLIRLADFIEKYCRKRSERTACIKCFNNIMKNNNDKKLYYNEGEIMEKHFMIDIETTGVNKEKDSILEVALVEIEYKYPYWLTTGKVFHEILHYSGQPENAFAKKHMSELYKKCNEQKTHIDYAYLNTEITNFIHDGCNNLELPPKFFMGWNASNFDIPFMFTKNILKPSYYKEVLEGKEELFGDVHYRIYEQTGALNLVANMSGLDRKTVNKLGKDLNPTGIELPKGKSHDALYDCYQQIIMMNGLIEICRKGIMR